MNYPIGDVARTLGLTTAALHFYERDGISETIRGAGTHRTYDVPEIVRLLSYKKYRHMELSLKEIAAQFSNNGGSFSQIGEKLARQRDAAMQMSARYARLAGDVDWFAQRVHQAEGSLGRVDVAAFPPCYMLCVGEDGIISRNRAEQERIAAWLEEMPATHISVTCDSMGRARFCYSLEEERARALGLAETPGAVHRASQTALHTFVALDKRFFHQPEMAFTLLRDFLQEHGFTQAGDGLGVSLCVSHENQERTTLCEVWLPFR